MRRAIEVKHWFFRHFAFVASMATVPAIGVAVYYRDQMQWQFLLTGTTVWLSLIHFVQKQRLEELRLFTDLFREFNRRYDDMNEQLARIASLPATGTVSDSDEAILIDYFNLCGEEFLYYQQGYIFPEVWKAWLRGMRYYYCHPLIGAIWDRELKGNSYYGLAAHHLAPECGSGESEGSTTPAVQENELVAGVRSLDSVNAAATSSQEIPGEA